MSVQSSIRRRRLLLLLAPLFAFVALASWAIASPVGASPDDDYHLNSIWCGQGERAGLCESASAPETEKVPGALEQSRCYSFLSDQSASCQGAGFSGADNPLVASQRGNFDGNYPPVFYATMSVFASDNISLSVIAMRLFNAFLFVALMTAACFALPRRLRVPLVWGTAICVTPLALFLVPSTNPSSWAILSGSLVWVSLVGYFESSGWRRITLGALSAVGVLIGAGARADSAIYAGLAIVVAIVLTMRFSKIYLLRAILPVALLVLSVAMYFSTNQAGAAMTGLVNGNPIEGTPESIFSRIFLNVPTLWSGILGSGDLGWLDTPLPSVVGFLVLGVFGGLVFRGLRHVDWRKGRHVLQPVGAAHLHPLRHEGRGRNAGPAAIHLAYPHDPRGGRPSFAALGPVLAVARPEDRPRRVSCDRPVCRAALQPAPLRDRQRHRRFQPRRRDRVVVGTAHLAHGRVGSRNPRLQRSPGSPTDHVRSAPLVGCSSGIGWPRAGSAARTDGGARPGSAR
jgi:hypothetical protein